MTRTLLKAHPGRLDIADHTSKIIVKNLISVSR